MVFKISIGPRARQHIQQGIVWYNQQGKNLGYKFYEEVERTLKIIQRNPYFQTRYSKVRCIPVRRFPYMVHFIVNEPGQFISIQSVLHTSMDPKYWKDRGENIP